MNKEEFLQTVRGALQGVAPEEIEAILADYRQHFDESAAHGRSEEATSAALGDPLWLAREHLLDRRPKEEGVLAAIKRQWAGVSRPRKQSDEIITRELSWVPGVSMRIRLPIEVSWRFAEKVSAVCYGPAHLVEHICLDSQELRGRFQWRFFQDNRLRVALEGPSIETWSILGSATVRLLQLSQRELSLTLEGSGEIHAAGAVEAIDVRVEGSGDIDLALLHHQRASVHIIGSGEVILGPIEAANLCVEGHGDITLLTRPPMLNTKILGGGDINMPS